MTAAFNMIDHCHTDSFQHSVDAYTQTWAPYLIDRFTLTQPKERRSAESIGVIQAIAILCPLLLTEPAPVSQMQTSLLCAERGRLQRSDPKLALYST